MKNFWEGFEKKAAMSGAALKAIARRSANRAKPSYWRSSRMSYGAQKYDPRKALMNQPGRR